MVRSVATATDRYKLTVPSSETELVQTIPHTSNSLWSCAVVPIPTGSGYYIASSANDSTIRVFTRREDLMASAQDRAEWDKEVGGRQLDKLVAGCGEGSSADDF